MRIQPMKHSWKVLLFLRNKHSWSRFLQHRYFHCLRRWKKRVECKMVSLGRLKATDPTNYTHLGKVSSGRIWHSLICRPMFLCQLQDGRYLSSLGWASFSRAWKQGWFNNNSQTHCWVVENQQTILTDSGRTFTWICLPFQDCKTHWVNILSVVTKTHLSLAKTKGIFSRCKNFRPDMTYR